MLLCLYICLPASLSVYIFVCLYIFLYLSLFLSVSVCVFFVCLIFSLSVNVPVWLYVCISDYLSVIQRNALSPLFCLTDFLWDYLFSCHVFLPYVTVFVYGYLMLVSDLNQINRTSEDIFSKRLDMFITIICKTPKTSTFWFDWREYDSRSSIIFSDLKLFIVISNVVT